MAISLIGFGWQEILIVALIVLLLFGGKKLPELMRGLGKGIREFNAAKNQVKDEIDNYEEETSKN